MTTPLSNIVLAKCPCGEQFIAVVGTITTCPACDETLSVPSQTRAKPASAESAGNRNGGLSANPPARGGDN